MATQTRERRESVPMKQFLTTYIKGCRKGLTNEEIAEKLGMEPNSVTSRASQLRRKFKEHDPPVDIPYPKSNRGAGRESFDEVVDLVSDLLAEDEDEDEPAAE